MEEKGGGKRKEHKQINKRKRGREAKTKESFEMQIEKIPRVHRRANGLPINSVQFNAILTLRSSSTWYSRTFFSLFSKRKLVLRHSYFSLKNHIFPVTRRFLFIFYHMLRSLHNPPLSTKMKRFPVKSFVCFLELLYEFIVCGLC